MKTVTLAQRPALRRRMRSLRRSMRPRAATEASVAMTRRLLRLDAFRAARRVAAYWPIDGEPDVREALLTANARGATALLPALSARADRPMRFARWHPGTPLLRNRYGIPEPAPVARRYYSPLAINLVIAPLVAFDGRGHRLGLGGGYYDRAFAAYARRRRPWTTLVGVAYEHQRVDSLEIGDWDVTLDCVITERGVYRFR